MLTDSEKKWLEEREERTFKYCIHCPGYTTTIPCVGYWAELCIMDENPDDYRDAAEFEARVAAKLADRAGHIALTLKTSGLPQLKAHEMLKIARLAVEQEMK